MNRRDFIGVLGGLIATSSLPSPAAEWKGAGKSLFASRGRFERLAMTYVHLPIGVKEPFSILHISDTHLTAVYPSESEKKRKLGEIRTRTFGGRQEEALRDSLAWAKDNADYVIHTGDLIDFQSEANFDLVKKYFGSAMTGSMGNHEFSPEMWMSEPKETKDEAFKDRSRATLSAVYPFDISFQSTVVNGVNFITMDNVYGTVTEGQAAKFKSEVATGLPIVLCMHMPIASRLNRMVQNKYWMGGRWDRPSMKFRGGLGDEPQIRDAVTREFVAMLRSERLLKAILAGHNHYALQERFSGSANQYIVGPNFMFHGQEILFT